MPKKTPAKRADLGAPIDGFFEKQPEPQRAILLALRALVEKVAPGAESSIKWGQPFYTVGGKMFAALGSHKAHVNLIMTGTDETFDDPDGLLSGTSKLGKHLEVTALDEIPKKQVERWLRASLKYAKEQ